MLTTYNYESFRVFLKVYCFLPILPVLKLIKIKQKKRYLLSKDCLKAKFKDQTEAIGDKMLWAKVLSQSCRLKIVSQGKKLGLKIRAKDQGQRLELKVEIKDYG